VELPTCTVNLEYQASSKQGAPRKSTPTHPRSLPPTPTHPHPRLQIHTHPHTPRHPHPQETTSEPKKQQPDQTKRHHEPKNANRIDFYVLAGF
jgi:hypothetical protein